MNIREYKLEYFEVNYEHENVQKVDCTKQKPCLIGCEYMIGETIEKKKIEYFEVEIIEEKMIECCEVEEKKVELIEEVKKLMSIIKEIHL